MKFLFWLLLSIWLFFDLQGCGYQSSRDEATTNDTSAEAAQDVNQGPAGRDGKDGKDGADGESSTDTPLNAWHDPATGFNWLIGSKSRWQDLSRCKGDFGAPTADELLDASYRGLIIFAASIGADSSAWASEQTDAVNASYVSLNGSSVPTVNAGAKTSAHGLFCISKK